MSKHPTLRRFSIACVLSIGLVCSLTGCQAQHSSPKSKPASSSNAKEEKEKLSMGEFGNYFQDKYLPSKLTQKDVESDTIQWICSSYAIYTKNNKKDLGYIGGTSEEHLETYQYALKDALRSGWKIYDRESLQHSLNKLLSTGERSEYQKTIQSMIENGLMDMTEEELIAQVQNQNGDEEEFRFLYRSYQCLGKKALDGWDYCRALQVLGDCYQTGYISLEECLDQSLVIAKKLQSTFSSWEEVAKSYLYGHFYHKRDHIATEWCWNLYEELKSSENNPYQIPYDTPLTDTWNKTL